MPPELASAASTDVASAFGALELVDFAALHVTRVVAHVDAQRGLADGGIVGAQAPRRVRAGQQVRVRLRVRVYRGPLRTVSFRLRIPSGARGATTVTIKGPPPPAGLGASTQGLAGALSSLLSSASSSGPTPGITPISSLAELRQVIARPGRLRRALRRASPATASGAVYRDPSLVMTGRATVRFAVAR